MIAKPSIAFNDFAGTAKDVTARNVNGRNVLSVRAKQSRTVTPAQAISRNTLSKVSRAYKQLTDSQMKAWEALAVHLKGISTFGKPAEMTAHNAFVRINSNRQMAGEGILTEAPNYLTDIPEVDWESIWVTPSRILLTGIANPTGTYKLVAKMSAGQGTGVTSGWSKTVVISPGMEDDWGDAGLTELYTEKIGYMPAVDEKVFIELYWLDPASGLVGETMRTTAVCMSEEQAKEEGFTPRVQYFDDMFDDPQAHLVSANVEIPGGTSQMVVEATTDIKGFGSYFHIYSEDMPNEIVEGDTMVFGRATARPDFKPGIYSVSFRKTYSSGKNVLDMSISHRAGGYDKKSEVFGSNPIMR